MKFRFDGNQEYQLDAINAVVGLFEGHPRQSLDLSFVGESGFAAIPNLHNLSEATLLVNLQATQAAANLPVDGELACIEDEIEGHDGPITNRFPNFTVEMETGTGKTYVYIRAALDLFRHYGMRKFIIVVPSVAIREGVLKTLQITQDHLSEVYENTPYRYYVYDSENLTQLRQFALSDCVELMIMTIDSFNKASNVIRQTTDRLQGETPIHLVQATRPILILDEPQNMESELRVKALSALNPLFALRYSATHRNAYNLVYRLTPYDAYRQGLVKRIEVASVVEEDDPNRVFLRLNGVTTRKNTLTASIAVHKLMKRGNVKEKVINVRLGDSLEKKTDRAEYRDFRVDEIDAGDGFVRFSNNVAVRIGESRGVDRDALFREQIQYTVREHMRKQEKLRATGVKVLSLFFIDKVANYREDEGIIRRQFDEAFIEAKKEFPEWSSLEPASVQAAYFAERRRRGGERELLDSVSGETKEDQAAYELIMKNKEQLLSFEQPVAFIFSHSALREGWDNPNIFQICTLNETTSEIKKRQEIGRGVRLSVDQSGSRLHDEQINVLTVVANQSYQTYVAKLQSEIEEEYGAEGLPPAPPNARKRGAATLRKDYMLKEEFKQLWARIKQKTRYKVTIDTEKLLADSLPVIAREEFSAPQILITKAVVEVEDEDQLLTKKLSERLAEYQPGGRPLPNLVEVMANLMQYTSPPVYLTRHTLLKVFRQAPNREAALNNPHEFAVVAVRTLKDKLADQLVSGIKYERVNDWYEMSQFESPGFIESWSEYLVPAKRSLYDHAICNSQIERDFVRDLEADERVKLFVKLPNWFTVETPVGEYNPDWAIVLEERDEFGTVGDMLYLVRETKGQDRSSLRPNEKRKVDCGAAHFRDALGVNFKVVNSAAEVL